MARARAGRSKNQLLLWPEPERRAAARSDPTRTISWRGKRVHLIGIGGIGMSGIAKLLLTQGCRVTGCDASRSDITEGLVNVGIPVAVGHSPRHVSGQADIVVISAAIRDTNPELREARRRGIPVVKYAEVVGWLTKEHAGIAVSGSHGKTTTTSMIAYALSCAGRNPSVLVGGMVPQLGGNSRPGHLGSRDGQGRNGKGGLFVVEACEYDRSFLNLTPQAAAITNIDRDHLDYYSGLDELVETFGSFVNRVSPHGIVVVNGDDPNACRAASKCAASLETFGQGEDCTWRIGQWRRERGRTRFRVSYEGRDVGELELLVPGLYNIRNAMVCLAVCRFFGVSLETVSRALARFEGVRRRFDHLGDAAGVMVLDDYGHHPTEVRVTLDTARQEFPSRRLWCVFQPHQCSRTRLLLREFAESFQSADRVIVPDIYSVRDSAADRVSVHAKDLVHALRKNGVDAEYRSPLEKIVRRLLADVRSGDLVMTMGAGPVDHVARRLLKELKKREARDGLVLRS